MAAQRMLETDPAAVTFCSCRSTREGTAQAAARIRISDDIPVFRAALTRELEDHGLEVVASGSTGEAVDLAVCGIRIEQDWDSLEEMLGTSPVFAIVPEPFEDNKLRALGLGAAGASARNAALSDMVSAICAIPRGYMLIDLDLLRRLCLSLAPKPPFRLSGDEREWLRQLSGGATIAALARQGGYSEREMHRIMRRLYDRMDVANLYQALIQATRFRLLD